VVAKGAAASLAIVIAELELSQHEGLLCSNLLPPVPDVVVVGILVHYIVRLRERPAGPPAMGCTRDDGQATTRREHVLVVT
jgi:hypothetical protein